MTYGWLALADPLALALALELGVGEVKAYGRWSHEMSRWTDPSRPQSQAQGGPQWSRAPAWTQWESKSVWWWPSHRFTLV